MYYPWTITNIATKKIMCFKLIRTYHSCAGNKSSKLIRKEFQDYFAENLKHSVIRSSPVAAITDRTLAFTNAGMNQFKGIFLDYYEPPATRVVNSQKCVRVGGKHNDLSIVGKDSYHHTFFEMLGNWSFGDYFKEEACTYAWNLLINVYGIPEKYLYVTYFGGDEKLGIPADLECKDIWLRLGLPECRVLPYGAQHNFWEMGVSGPCGPCTEIHVDYMKRSTNQAIRVNKGYDDLMELWNIVFIQYNRLANGYIVPLAKHHVDTGMGLERLVTLLQGKRSNYDTDLFQPLFSAIQKYTNAPEYKGTFGNDDTGKIDYGYRILADHARMVTVALADNMLPKQQQKLRRILRSAINVGEKIFKKNDILTKLVDNVADNLGDTYLELHNNLKQVKSIIQFEEDLFKKLRDTSGKKWTEMVKVRPQLESITDWTTPGLVDGYKDLQSILKELCKTNVLPGTVAFKLYDTYGLNSETIAELAQIESLHFDEEDFQIQLDIRRYQSKIGLDKYNVTLTKESLKILEKNNVPKTDDSFKYNYTYDGNDYKFPTLHSKLIGILINGELVASKNYFQSTKAGDVDKKITISADDLLNDANEIGIILDKTVCYSLEGGQVSDKGNIRIKDLIFNVHSVRKIDNYVIHFGYFVKPNSLTSELYLEVGDDCSVNIDSQTRVGAMRHHTAAHLLNAAVKQVMHAVYQHVCTVDMDSLKFQFNSFGGKFTSEQMRIVEGCINNIIRSNVAVTMQTVNSLQLLKQDDITLVPGEIYPYTGIRIVEVNADDLKAKEPCCGTHIHNTGVLQHFYILAYSSKGATNCTFHAVVGPAALHMKHVSEKIWHEIVKLEDALQNEKFTYETFNKKINEIKQQINNRNTQAPLSYLFKEKCLTHLEYLSRTKWLHVKEIEKTAVTREITDTADSPYCFIVHCLTKNPTYLSLNEITALFSEIPILIISCNDRLVKARCSVPQRMVSEVFNARVWMDIVLKIFDTEHGSSIKRSHSLLVANMKSKQMPSECFRVRMEKAITEATKFVSTHARTIKTVNSKNQ